jgi:formylglycine-generating enzyme required for sulfatase activity
VKLPAFFLSKYEMTQGQWLRATGTNPSQYGSHNSNPIWSRSGRSLDLSHPVEKVSWTECATWCARLGLALPSEAQWEFAVRGGTSTPWWMGSDPAELETSANVADAWARDHGGGSGSAYQAWVDGYTVHAPAGSFAPNPFGLHDLLGNVWEWCQDGYFSYAGLPLEAPVAPESVQRARVRRGGSSGHPPESARSAARASNHQDAASGDFGLRPARPVTPAPR